MQGNGPQAKYILEQEDGFSKKIVHQQFSLIKPTCPFKMNAEQNGE